MIDLRSDTVTKPSAEMRQAMAEAEVGDDVFAEDPTVNRLQEKVAAMAEPTGAPRPFEKHTEILSQCLAHS